MNADTASGFGPLVSADWLAAHLSDHDLRVIDFRWELAAGSRRDLYMEGHIPGAAFIALEAVTGVGGPGRHPLPSRAGFEVAMRAVGVNVASRVVVYDAAGGFSAARLWWLLRHFGHDSVAVLDGGLDAWTASIQAGPVAVDPGDFSARERAGDVVSRDDLVAAPAATLIDARVGERYRGDIEPVDPRPGHIPGAVNVPWSANLDDRQRFLPPDRLRRQYAAAGVSPADSPVVYCGSGVSACVDLLALEVAGLGSGRLYEGSWSDWSAQPGLPAATGERPGGDLADQPEPL